MKQKTKIIIPLVIISSAIFILYKNKINLPIKDTDSSNNPNQNQDDKNLVTITLRQLSVLKNKCIGCGKCTKIDPFHFEISNQKAVVISSTNLDSSNLKLAINNCPVQAITLE